ncbi:MAG TPA: DUF2520 domain-containing protein [Herpetosiphonaceae bacterium]
MTLSSPLGHSTPADLATPLSDGAPPTIAIIGLGRVGLALGRAIHAAGYDIRAVSSRDPRKAQTTACSFCAEVLNAAEAARRADLVLLTVSDDAITTVARELGAAGAWRSGQFVVHASGVSPASALQPAADDGAIIGAFHPLAAFATLDATLPPGITFAIEAPPPLHAILWDLARALGGHALDLAPQDKTLYHAAAVIASNYTIVLAALAEQIFEQLGATPEQGLQALLPLMRTTLDNLERQRLPAALTGPLVRGDVGTVRRHIHALDQTLPHIGALYRCLAHGALPLAEQRGLSPQIAGLLQDTITLPSELALEHEQ